MEEYTIAQWIPPYVVRQLRKQKPSRYIHLTTVYGKYGMEQYFLNGTLIKQPKEKK